MSDTNPQDSNRRPGAPRRGDSRARDPMGIAARDDAEADETGADETGADETGADETGADEARPDEAGADNTPGLRRERLTGLARLAQYRLVVPIARGRHDGVPTARGTAIGLAFGLTPTVGIQMPMIFLFWALAKWFQPKWKFNLIVAFAWTWPTNILTAPAYYYLCLVTGRFLMGETAPLEFDAFQAQVENLLATDAGLLESLWVYTVEIFRTWGVPLFLGSVPYAVAGTWAGYVTTLKFVAKLRAQQRKQMLKRRAKRARARQTARENEEAARPEV